MGRINGGADPSALTEAKSSVSFVQYEGEEPEGVLH